MQGLPVSGPLTVKQVLLEEDAVVVDVVDVVVVVVVVVVLVVIDEVVPMVVQTLVLQTGLPLLSHTQVLHPSL